jgi:hypothetical protein
VGLVGEQLSKRAHGHLLTAVEEAHDCGLQVRRTRMPSAPSGTRWRPVSMRWSTAHLSPRPGIDVCDAVMADLVESAIPVCLTLGVSPRRSAQAWWHWCGLRAISPVARSSRGAGLLLARHH